jgi:hypothetical protein
VVVTNKRCYFGESGVLGDHVGTDIRMTPHNLPLFLGKRTRLVKDVVSYADLSKIV